MTNINVTEEIYDLKERLSFLEIQIERLMKELQELQRTI